MFLRQLMSIELSIVVNSGVFLVWVGKMRGRIGNPKQKLRGDRKKGTIIRADTTTNNKDYFNQQHQQLIPTKLRPKQHIGRSGGIC